MEITELKRNFSKYHHDFGDVVENSTHCIAITYNGNSVLSSGHFQATCGCTSVSYDNTHKTLTACLLMNIPEGLKEATVICNIPEGQEIIRLQGKIVKL